MIGKPANAAEIDQMRDTVAEREKQSPMAAADAEKARLQAEREERQKLSDAYFKDGDYEKADEVMRAGNE